MKIYARSIWLLLLITFFSLILIICSECGKIYDISLAIFGSSLISLIVSIIGYRNEKTKALEAFYNAVYKRIVYYNTYLESWSVEDKCNYFINHYLKDFPSIGDAYASIHFFLDINQCKTKYIYDNIYSKIKEMSDSINICYFDFSKYLNKTGVSKEIVEQRIKELETNLFNTDETDSQFNFSDEIMNELNGEYYKILYGYEYCKNNTIVNNKQAENKQHKVLLIALALLLVIANIIAIKINWDYGNSIGSVVFLLTGLLHIRNVVDSLSRYKALLLSNIFGVIFFIGSLFLSLYIYNLLPGYVDKWESENIKLTIDRKEATVEFKDMGEKETSKYSTSSISEVIDGKLIYKNLISISNYTFIYEEEPVKTLCYAIDNKCVEELQIKQ